VSLCQCCGSIFIEPAPAPGFLPNLDTDPDSDLNEQQLINCPAKKSKKAFTKELNIFSDFFLLLCYFESSLGFAR
jgi:hypothetical protein